MYVCHGHTSKTLKNKTTKCHKNSMHISYFNMPTISYSPTGNAYSLPTCIYPISTLHIHSTHYIYAPVNTVIVNVLTTITYDLQ